MDELYFNSTFSKWIVAKAIQKMVKDEIGYDIKVQLDALKISSSEGNTTVKVSGELTIQKEDVLKLFKSSSLI